MRLCPVISSGIPAFKALPYEKRVPDILHGQAIEMASLEYENTISGVGRNELHPDRYDATLTPRQFLPQIKSIRPSEACSSFTDAI